MRPFELGAKYNRNPASIILKLQKLNVFIPVSTRWTDEQIDILKNNYSHMDWNDLLIILSPHTRGEIIHKASKAGLKRDVYFWTDEEVFDLKTLYLSKRSSKDIAKYFNFKYTEGSVHRKAMSLGLRRTCDWSKCDIAILESNYSTLTLSEVEKLLPNHSKKSIITMSTSLGLLSLHTHNKMWSKEEDQILFQNWKSMSDSDLGLLLNKKQTAIKTRRHKYKLFREIPQAQYDYLYEFLRKAIKPWKKESARQCGYKCIVTQGKFDNIHHLYGMNLIVRETLETLNLTSSNFNNYTDEQNKNLLNTFLRIHSKYPLGVCLSGDIHTEFHKKYGYGDNIPEQFAEFLKNHYPASTYRF